MIAARDAAVAAFKAAMPELATCAAHGGRFTTKELARIATNTPAVHVGLAGFSGSELNHDGTTDVRAQYVAVVVTADRVQDGTTLLRRDTACANIAGVITGMVSGSNWDLEGVEPASRVRGENLFTGSLDDRGVAMFAVSWEHLIRLGNTVDEDGVVPSTLYLGRCPDIGPGNEGKYTLIYRADDEEDA